jgi:hypothetical protein
VKNYASIEECSFRNHFNHLLQLLVLHKSASILKGIFQYSLMREEADALSFYATKTVLVSPKWFWSDQIDLDLTIMIWSQPK